MHCIALQCRPMLCNLHICESGGRIFQKIGHRVPATWTCDMISTYDAVSQSIFAKSTSFLNYRSMPLSALSNSYKLDNKPLALCAPPHKSISTPLIWRFGNFDWSRGTCIDWYSAFILIDSPSCSAQKMLCSQVSCVAKCDNIIFFCKETCCLFPPTPYPIYC